MIASETTVTLTGETLAWRELDTIRVKGRINQLKIHQLLALAANLTASQAAATADYAKDLAHWRAGEFELAAKCFERSAEADRPSRMFLERARIYAKQAPAGEWDQIRTLQEK